jgi:hypothetical protein
MPPLRSPGLPINAHNANRSDADGTTFNDALISRQRQRYLASLLSDQDSRSDNQYREQ